MDIPRTVIMASNGDKVNVTDHGIGPQDPAGEDFRASPVVNMRKPCKKSIKFSKNQQLKVCTWNVKTLYEAGKLRNLLQEMDRLDISILGVCETRWPNNGHFTSQEYQIYYSGTNDESHQNGVAVILKKSLAKSVKKFVPLSDRVMLVQLAAYPVNINIIQIYAPTADKDDTVVESLYQLISEALGMTKKHEITIIMGDFNAKVGSENTLNITGKFGLGNRNNRGERLVQFCQEEKFVIMNTWFCLPNRRLYTWKAPSDREDNIIRNQIDYVLINERFKNCIKSVKTYPGADIHSDHTLLCSKIKIKLKKINKTQKTPTIALDSLHEPFILNKVSQEINTKMHAIKIEGSSTANDNWKQIKTSIMTTAQNNLTKKRKAKKEWMTQDILDLMDIRRQHKTKNREKYNKIHKEIRKRIKAAKERWLKESCLEIEKLERQHDSFHLHKKLKELTGTCKTYKTSIIRDSSGKILSEVEERCTEWKNYIKELFKDDQREYQETTSNRDKGPPILVSEVQRAIDQAKRRKTPGPDEVPAELMKLLDDESVGIITSLFNKIYSTGEIPDDWLESLFVTIPKKSNPKECGDYRLISLMSHTLKIFLKILHHRIYRLCEDRISDEQFGFRGGMGTREALFCMRTLLQKSVEFRKNIYVCFIDFEKAFDNVPHTQLFQCLDSIGLDSYDVRLLKNLYYNQTARVKVEQEVSEKVPIKRGVRQGCVMSPMLFNVYSEAVFEGALKYRHEGVKIGGEVINNIRYADDTAIMAESLEDLQTLLNAVNNACKEKGLSVNTKKTKWMVVGKINIENPKLKLGGKTLDRVQHFRYLGSWINCRVESDEEISTRIELARKTFTSWSSVLCNRNLSINIRLRVLKCYVWSVLLYGCETWTLKVKHLNKLEAFELWCYRRMLKIPWTAHVTNESVLKSLHKERELTNIIKSRKVEYFGHIMRGHKYHMLRLIMQGKIEGKRWIGRKQLSWLRNIRHWTGRTVEELFHVATDREAFQQIVNSMITNA